MRIVGGKFGGRKIPSPKSDTIRPTSDFVREALFNILNNVLDFENIVVCDVFAGTGALGLEAISRGADFAYFVEKNRMNANNIKSLMQEMGVEKSEFSVICGDAKKVLSNKDNFDKEIDLFIADPPYALKVANETLRLADENLPLSEGAIIVLEYGQNEAILVPENYELIAQKKFVETQASVLRKL